MLNDYVKKILEAHVYDVAIETPIDRMNILSKELHNNILVKREDLQPVFSFKLRGAYNKINNLSKKEQAKGIIAASAGNHAQGVALAALKKKISATIVMPRTTPSIKVSSVKNMRAKVILYGDTFDEAYEYSLKLKKSQNLTFIHPYDDPDTIAGQGTIGMEIVRQYPGELHAVFVPVGGGGLIAGVSAYIKYLRPNIKIIGVEPEDSACLYQALKDGKRSILPHVGIFADGVAVKQIGKETFKIAQQCVDEVITVNTDEICSAIKELFNDTRSIAEPAGALAVAGLRKYIKRDNITDANLLAIESGANVNFDRLRHISERSEIGENREAILAVTIPEKPGSFRRFCKALKKHSITEFNYRYSDTAEAQVFVGIQLDQNEDRQSIIEDLVNKEYKVVDLTDNELAKLHIRHMVGGRSKNNQDEQIYRFQFPERPGAISSFLESMDSKWNISMFHYRNHGSAFGRVFLGLEVPLSDRKQLKSFIKNLNYNFTDENENPAYKLFLQ